MALFLRLVETGETVAVTGDIQADWDKVAALVTNYLYECDPALPPTANQSARENCINNHVGPPTASSVSVDVIDV